MTRSVIRALPQGWSGTKLAALVERIEAGPNVQCDERPPTLDERGLVKISAVTWGRFDESKSKTLPAHVQVDERKRIGTGDLLISRANTIELVGATVIVEEVRRRLYLSDKVLRLIVREPSKRWVNYALKAPAMRKAIEDASSGNQLSMRNISQEKLLALNIPLAPALEQTRIADKLDAVLARVDACRDRLDRIPDILKRFRQSVVASAISGRLTETNSRQRDSKPWEQERLKDVCLSIADGDHQAPPQRDSGIPFITIGAINDGKLNLRKASRWVPKTYFDGLRNERRPARGDVLFSVTGSICIPAFVDTDEPFCFQRHIAVLRPDQRKISSEYLYIALASDHVSSQGRDVATGTAQLTIPLNGLRAISIPVPPLDEQAEIVHHVKALFSLADRMEVRYVAARAHADRLAPSLLAKAFRGELVEQDPEDEPASELLARIAKQGVNPAAKAPARKRRSAA